MYSISKLCKAFQLSRSTLLYYDSIDLLKASARTGSNYRVYSEEDKLRLEQICTYREAGVPLEQIKGLLDSQEESEKSVLLKRLSEIYKEIRLLRLQQKIIVELLNKKNTGDGISMLDSNVFVNILKSCGIDEEAMDRLHIEFEKSSPDEHQSFLEFLGIDEASIRMIRESAKNKDKHKIVIP